MENDKLSTAQLNLSQMVLHRMFESLAIDMISRVETMEGIYVLSNNVENDLDLSILGNFHCEFRASLVNLARAFDMHYPEDYSFIRYSFED